MITLVATAHREGGKCNSAELYKIIERISPEIIFEEISPNEYVAIYKGLRADNLESKTLKRYWQKHSIEHLAVDIEPDELIDIRLKNEISELFGIFNTNPKYDRLSIQHNNLTEHFGFSYLNSDQCSVMLERIHLLEEAILRAKNQEKLFQTYMLWLNIHEKRENEMINNIYNYSKQKKYENGLFLVGAAHRKSIIEKIPKFENDFKLKLNWIFN